MGGDPDRLVHDDDVVVVVEDAETLDRRGFHRHRTRRGGQPDLQPGTAADPVGPAPDLPVKARLAVVDERGGHGPRQPEHPRDRRVETDAVEPVRDR